MSSTAQLSPGNSMGQKAPLEVITTPTDQPIIRRGCPKAPKRKKKKKKKKQSYKDMMNSILKSDKTTAEKIQEKREALRTPNAQPPKLVTI